MYLFLTKICAVGTGLDITKLTGPFKSLAPFILATTEVKRKLIHMGIHKIMLYASTVKMICINGQMQF